MVKSYKLKHSYYTFHIHLFESEKGKRKIETYRDGNYYDMNNDRDSLKSVDTYQLKIYRWLNGRRDPEIPQYSEISEEDTSNFLKGTIP